MSDNPRTDAALAAVDDEAPDKVAYQAMRDIAATLERELAEAKRIGAECDAELLAAARRNDSRLEEINRLGLRVRELDQLLGEARARGSSFVLRTEDRVMFETLFSMLSGAPWPTTDPHWKLLEAWADQRRREFLTGGSSSPAVDIGDDNRFYRTKETPVTGVEPALDEWGFPKLRGMSYCDCKSVGCNRESNAGRVCRFHGDSISAPAQGRS